MKDYPWLRYSESTNSLFCAYYVLFGPKEKGNISFSFSVTNWSNLSQLIKRHLLDKSKHHDYAGIGDDFMKIADSESPSTTSSLSSVHQETTAKNRHILSNKIQVVILCGRQNIPMRGHKEDGSNFIAILESPAKNDPILSDHLAFSTSIKYTSPDVQNEIQSNLY